MSITFRPEVSQEICANESSTVVGILKGFDQLMNLVLDEVKETLRGKILLLAHTRALLT